MRATPAKGKGKGQGNGMTAADVRQALAQAADPTKAAVLRRFFKTAAGQYGEADQSLGITVPRQRAIARQFRALPLADALALLASPVHWDLVDSSAPYLLGDWLRTHDRRVLRTLARSLGGLAPTDVLAGRFASCRIAGRRSAAA